jgi:hypothetical protein
LHGLPKTIVSARDSRFMSTFWQELFRLVGTALTPRASYHPQTDGQTEIVNKWLEGYLRNYVSGQHKAWVKWLHLGEYCYNTTYHMSIGMSPFQDLYKIMTLSLLWRLYSAIVEHPCYRIGSKGTKIYLESSRIIFTGHKINRKYRQTSTGWSVPLRSWTLCI